MALVPFPLTSDGGFFCNWAMERQIVVGLIGEPFQGGRHGHARLCTRWV